MALENLQNRFLFPNPATMVQDDPLGSLPEGWGKSKIYNKRRYGVNSKTMTQKKTSCAQYMVYTICQLINDEVLTETFRNLLS